MKVKILILLNLITFLGMSTEKYLESKEVQVEKFTKYTKGSRSTIDPSEIKVHYLRTTEGKFFIIEIPTQSGQTISIRWRYFDA